MIQNKKNGRTFKAPISTHTFPLTGTVTAQPRSNHFIKKGSRYNTRSYGPVSHSHVHSHGNRDGFGELMHEWGETNLMDRARARLALRLLVRCGRVDGQFCKVDRRWDTWADRCGVNCRSWRPEVLPELAFSSVFVCYLIFRSDVHGT